MKKHWGGETGNPEPAGIVSKASGGVEKIQTIVWDDFTLLDVSKLGFRGGWSRKEGGVSVGLFKKKKKSAVMAKTAVNSPQVHQCKGVTSNRKG